MKIIEKERYEYYWEKEITLIHKSVMIKNGKKKKTSGVRSFAQWLISFCLLKTMQTKEKKWAKISLIIFNMIAHARFMDLSAIPLEKIRQPI